MNKGINPRQRELLNILMEKKYSSVHELSNTLFVSEPTIRRDLDHLLRMGVIEKIHGGARVKEHEASFITNSNKYYSLWEEKARIGKEASKFVHENDLIAINSGSTVMAFLDNIWNFENLTFVSQDYVLAELISQKKGFTSILAGGLVQKRITSIIGKNNIDIFESFLFDACFLGVESLNPKDGIMMNKYALAYNSRVIIDRSKKVIILADSTKFRRNTGAVVAPFESIDVLITDSGITKDNTLLKQISKFPNIDFRIV